MAAVGLNLHITLLGATSVSYSPCALPTIHNNGRNIFRHCHFFASLDVANS